MKLQESDAQCQRAGRKMFMSHTHPLIAFERVAFCLFTTLICSFAVAQSPDTVRITDQCVRLDISNFFRQLSAPKTPGMPPAEGSYKHMETHGRLLPASKHDNILRVILHNAGSSDRLFKLWLCNPDAQLATLQIISKDGVLKQVVSGKSDIITSGERLTAFPIAIRKDYLSELYINIPRFESPATLMPVIIDAARPSPFLWTDHLMMVIIGLLFSAVLASVMVARWFPVMDTAWLLALVISVTGYTLASSGIGSLYVWPAPANASVVIFFAAAANICFLELGRRLIGANKQYPRLNKLLLILFALYGAATIARLAGNDATQVTAWYPFAEVVFGIVAGVLTLVMFEAAIYNAVMKRKTKSWWFAAALCSAFISQVINSLWVRGIIEYSVGTQLFVSAIRFIPQTIFVFTFLVQRLFTYSTRRNQEIAMMAAFPCKDCHLYPDPGTK